MKLDAYGAELLGKRFEVGRKCAVLAGLANEEIETAASDAISDILTFVYGARGYYRHNLDENTIEFQSNGKESDAQELLDRSLRSWEGDSEDYTETIGGDSPIAKINKRLDEVSALYRKTVEPGVSDDSVLEAERDTLEWVLATLKGQS